MRFVAALVVFFSHARYLGLFGDTGVSTGFEWLFRQGPISVNFFFVLSGFILAWSARSDDTAPRFWRRRFFKIYPNHLLTFVAALVIFATMAQSAVTDDYAFLNLFLVQSWSSSMAAFSSVNPITWTLSCEVLFYFLFPVLLRLVKRIAPARLWFWAIGVVVAVFAVATIATVLVPAQPPVPWTESYSLPQYWLVYVFPPLRIFDFVFGIILARIVLTGRRLPLGLAPALLLTIASYVLATEVQGPYSLVAISILPVGLLIAAGAKADIEGTRTFVGGKRMVWAGEISYAFYLWHYLVLFHGLAWLDNKTALSTPAGLGLLALLIAMTTLLGWLTFVLVERPIMRRFAVSKRHRKAAVDPREPTSQR
jgi:mycarose O-acyltransferase